METIITFGIPGIQALADVVLLDRSLAGIDPGEIRRVQVKMTIIGGKVTYEKK